MASASGEARHASGMGMKHVQTSVRGELVCLVAMYCTCYPPCRCEDGLLAVADARHLGLLLLHLQHLREYEHSRVLRAQSRLCFICSVWSS